MLIDLKVRGHYRSSRLENLSQAEDKQSYCESVTTQKAVLTFNKAHGNTEMVHGLHSTTEYTSLKSSALIFRSEFEPPSKPGVDKVFLLWTGLKILN